MTDIPPIQGPGIPHPPPKKAETSSVEADKFHKEMQKKVEKISETDQEQKKKRKRKEEAEDEEEPKAPAGPTSPDLVTPFSLVEEEKKVNPLQIQKGGAVSPLASSQPTATPKAPASAPPPPPSVMSEGEMEDDSAFLESDSAVIIPTEEEALPPALYTATPPAPPQAPAPSAPPPYETEQRTAKETTEDTAKDTVKEPSKQQPSQKKEEESTPETKKGDKETKPAVPPSTQPTQRARQTKQGAHSLPAEEKKGVSARELEKGKEPQKLEETTGFFEQFIEDKDKLQKKEVKPKEAESLRGEEEIAPITPLSASNYLEKEKHDKGKEAFGIEAPAAAAPLVAGAPAPLETPPAAVTPYANLHPEVMDLFDRMVGVISVMSASGIKETVVTLNAPKFASSVFFGSQIIIHEYTSAPLAYNIQINGNPQAVALFQGNADDLMAAFQYGNYNFRVNRLETGLMSERPQVRRKEPPAGGQDQRGSKNK